MSECIFNACNLSSEDNTPDMIHEDLQKQITALLNTTTAKMLMFEGKLSDLCKYIKDNLSNQIRELLYDMKYTGELDQIITDTLLNAIELMRKDIEGLKDIANNYVNVCTLNVTGNGTTDDSDAIEKAANTCDYPLLFPEGEYVVTRDIIVSKDNTQLIGQNAVIILENDATIIFKDTKNVSVTGITFKQGGGVGFDRVNGFNVKSCTFYNGMYGIKGSHCYVGEIDHCEMSDCEYGIIFDKSLMAPNSTADHNAIFVHHNKLYNNTYPFITRGGYVGGFCENNVEGNKNGIIIEGMADYSVDNNYFEYNKGTIITLNNYVSILNSNIHIGGNRLFGDSTKTVVGLSLSGTIIGLVLDCNSWGGLGELINKGTAVLSRPTLCGQVNNSGLQFPTFTLNMSTIDNTYILPEQSAKPTIMTGRMYTHGNCVCAQTKLGDYILDYQLGYVPTLNTAPKSGEGLLFKLPNGTLQVIINGEVKTITTN